MTAVDADQLECALLGVLLDAESARDGSVALLSALAPLVEDSAAIAMRDRDGRTLHVLAEHGDPATWPQKLDARTALSAQPIVDTAGTMVVPLRAKGRVVGALLLADAKRAAILLREPSFDRAVHTTAAVLEALLTRTELELYRRGNALRSVEAIVEGMAHQMANPLTGASAMTQILAEELATDAQRSAIGQIRHELDRAFTVLRDLLEFQRDTRAHDGVLDLNAVAERVLRFRGYAIREAGIAIDFETAPEFVPVRADNRSLEHAMLVALRSAELRSMGTVNRNIHVRVTIRDGEGSIDITDSGPGEIPELVPAWFDLRFRGDDAPGAPPDLGLVDSILRGAGGRLEAGGSKTDGTTVSLILPRAATPAPPAAPATPVSPPKRS